MGISVKREFCVQISASLLIVLSSVRLVPVLDFHDKLHRFPGDSRSSVSRISLIKSDVSSHPVPFPSTIVSIWYFHKISASFARAFFISWRNILSNVTGFPSGSMMHVLHPARYPGSIARMVFPYSGRVMRSA